ncbi:MAG: hypothetical protein MUF45_08365 [Spirosomaceae bacterium]|nr:hypothetical protein [Spirosomataceae bacterium]
MTKAQKIVIILGLFCWVAIGWMIYVNYYATKPIPKPKPDNFPDTKLPQYRAVKVFSKLGPVKIYIKRDSVHKISIHKSYHPFSKYEVKNDTLNLWLENVPQDQRKKVQRSIYLFVKELDFIDVEAGETIITGFHGGKISAINRSGYLRFWHNYFDEIKLSSAGVCNFRLEQDNACKKLEVFLSNRSKLTANIQILDSFSLEAGRKSEVNIANYNKSKLKKFVWDVPLEEALK